MNTAILKIAIEVDDKGSMKIRQVGEESARAGKKGSDGFRAMTSSMAETDRTASMLATTVKGMGAALSVGLVAHYTSELIKLADAYTRSEGRLRLVTESQQELTAVQSELYALSQRTRTEYLSNVDVYSRLGQSTKDLHLAQSQLLTIEETLVKAFAVSGATGEETKATMIQLSQAFSAGVLRGEEFNSVSEQGGRVLQLLADYLGKSRGELRAMAEAGELTADILVDAILSGASKVNAEFDKMPLTVGQAQTSLENTWGSIISGANNSTGATNKIATSIIDLRDTIDSNREGIISLFSSIIDLAAFGAKGIIGLANSVRGMSAVAAGALDFTDFMTMDSKALAQWFKDYDSGLAQMRKRTADAAALVKKYAEEDPDVVDETAYTSAVRNYGRLQKELAAYESAQKKATATTQNDTVTTTQHTSQQGLAAVALANLKKELLPVEEAQRKYKSTVEQVNKALGAGQISQTQANAMIDEAKKKMDQASGATAAHKKALSEQTKAARAAAKAQKEQEREIKQTLDHVLPLRHAQEEYNQSLANLKIALAAGTISQTEYSSAVAYMDRELAAAKEQADSYAKSMRDAERATQESALTINGTKIEIAIAQGQLTETEALPFQVDLLQQRLTLQQQILTEMQKSTPEEISAWNSQAEAIQQTTLQLAEYQQKLRMQDPYQGMVQGLKDVAEQAKLTGEDIRDYITGAFDSINETLVDYLAGDGGDWKSLLHGLSKDMLSLTTQSLFTGPMAGLLGGMFPGASGMSDVTITSPMAVYINGAGLGAGSDILADTSWIDGFMGQSDAAASSFWGSFGAQGDTVSSSLWSGFGSEGESAFSSLFSGLGDMLGGLFGSSGEMGGLLTSAMALFGFADGGVMTASGPLPLHYYASGGIASSPQLAVFGEGRMNEAYVPLPDGRSIPVSMSGGSSDGETKALLKELIGAVKSGGSTRIVNTISHEDIINAMDSSSGERVILNVIKRNPSLIRQVAR